MTTSRNNTIMSWMAYTDFLSRLRIAAGILLPLNTRTLLLYPGGRDCIGAAGVDTYLTTISKTLLGKVSDSILIWNDLKKRSKPKNQLASYTTRWLPAHSQNYYSLFLNDGLSLT